MAKKKRTGMGTDAFFSPQRDAPQRPTAIAEPAQLTEPQTIKERRSFNLSTDALRLLDEIQIMSMREGKKMSLSAIVERGISLVASEKGVNE